MRRERALPGLELTDDDLLLVKIPVHNDDPQGGGS